MTSLPMCGRVPIMYLTSSVDTVGRIPLDCWQHVTSVQQWWVRYSLTIAIFIHHLHWGANRDYHSTPPLILIVLHRLWSMQSATEILPLPTVLHIVLTAAPHLSHMHLADALVIWSAWRLLLQSDVCWYTELSSWTGSRLRRVRLWSVLRQLSSRASCRRHKPGTEAGEGGVHDWWDSIRRHVQGKETALVKQAQVA